jgi:hypothetical protein
MAYIGREPQIGNYQVCDAISVVNGQAAYTMQVSSVNVIPESVNHMIVSLNGVIQNPGSSYTISSSTITFSSNLATGDSIDFIYLLGNVLDLGTPSDSTVTTAKLSGNLVTPGTLDVNGQELILDADADTSITADTDDQIDIKVAGADDFRITANTFTALSGSGVVIPDSGLTLGSTAVTSTAAELNLLDGVSGLVQADLTKLAAVDSTAAELNIVDGGTSATSTTIVDADRVVLNDNGTMVQAAVTDLKTYIGGNPITLADQWHITASIDAGNSNTDTVITNWTQDGYGGYGKIGTMSESSGVFTFPSTGMYLCQLALTFYYGVAASNYNYTRLQIATDGSSFSTRVETTNFTRASENYITTSPASAIVDVTNTSNVKVRPVYHVRSSGTDVEGGSIVRSRFTFIRLGDT